MTASPGWMAPGLVPRDVCQGRPQDRLVVHADGSKQGHAGREHVGGVVPPAEPGLHDRQVHPLALEGEHGQAGLELEIGQLVPAVRGHDLVAQLHPGLARQHGPVDLHPLAGRDEMGRGEQPGLPPVGAGDGAQKGGRGPLAVGADHVDHGDVRHGARITEGLHPVQGQVHVKEPQPVHVFGELGIIGEMCHGRQSIRKRPTGEAPATTGRSGTNLLDLRPSPLLSGTPARQ